MIHILYRISSNSYNKKRIKNATKKKCLLNALSVFDSNTHNWELYGDAVNEETQKEIDEILIKFPKVKYTKINTGSGAASFNVVLTEALKKPDEDIIYFLEDDYIWLEGGNGMIEDTLNSGAHYYTSYNHPDKYIPPPKGNPEVDVDGGYFTKIYNIKGNFYYIVNSTTMTFASKVKTLKDDESILRKHTIGTYPNDFQMFLELRNKGKILLCSINSFSSHSENMWLAPMQNIKPDELESYWDNQLTCNFSCNSNNL